MKDCDVLIVGAGPVGLATALALRDAGLAVVVADARAEGAACQDPRTLALSHGTRQTLERLGAWQGLQATPITRIHVSQQHGFGRTLIRAEEEDVPALGHVVSAGALASVLLARLKDTGTTLLHGAQVGESRLARDDVAAGSEQLTVTLRIDGGEARIRTRLLACAEGRLSESGSETVTRDYGQHALIGFVEARGGHANTAYERFTPDGPVALLPCGDAFALVHVCPPERAAALMALDDASYLAVLQSHLGRRVTLAKVGERLCYPLALRYRKAVTATRTAWLGNAAQTLHPVAGQGFNLALRDVWALAEAIRRHPGDPGSEAVLAAYQRARALDRRGTITFTDTLVRLFSNDVPPLRHLRGAGLLALDMLPPLRSFVARRMMFGARAWP